MSMNKSTECQSIFKAAREFRECTLNVATTSDRDVQACNITNTCVAKIRVLADFIKSKTTSTLPCMKVLHVDIFIWGCFPLTPE